MSALQKVLAWLIFGAAILGGACIGWAAGNMTGRSEGRKLERADQDKQSVKDLTGLIDSHKDLISQAAAASKGMRQALGARSTADTKTTQEFKDALSLTADSRAGCVFPADVMRQLSAAHGRAAQAAASGIRGPLPAASPAATDR